MNSTDDIDFKIQYTYKVLQDLIEIDLEDINIVENLNLTETETETETKSLKM